MSKNSAFHKLPSNGRYGLREWYPDIKNTKDAKAKSNGVDAVSDDDKPLHEELQAEEDSQSTSPVKSAK